ncbi:MAG: hypothetical protein KDB00_15930, partial [Planctomycetales bacterium]|nr:hypothetical protein [Planctomycetales bacterium]
MKTLCDSPGWMLSLALIFFAHRGISVAGDFAPQNTQAAGQEPLEAQEAAKRLHVPPGFQITLAASEPDVRQPIAIALDDRGRLWVAESYSYDGSTFTDERHDRILIFEDSTGDGILDRRTVFCDGLTHLTGLEIGFGGVWITAPPNLAFLPDRNHDDRADGDPIVHLDGWSLKAEHNSVNGLTWGPDGWLYGRHGIKQPSLVGRPGVKLQQRIELSCCIWRYHPTGMTFEVVADGTINPWGLDFDDHGQGFLTTSVVEHLWHLVPGAHYERWKDRGVNPNPFAYEAMSATSDHLHWGSGGKGTSGKGTGTSAPETWDKAGRMAEGNQHSGGGHSHCDAMIYLGGRWPDEFRGSLFTSNIHGRRINQDRLLRAGGPFRGVHAEDFLVADDPWFRAVSLEYGPDGDVYMTDWSDNGECHDRDGVHRTSGRIYKITWGRPRRVEVNLGDATSEQLVEYQFHENDWFVRHARRLLQERAASGVDLSRARERLFTTFDSERSVPHKLRAMWALYGCGGLSDQWLVDQFDHPSEHVRAWAVRLSVDQGEPSAAVLSKLSELASIETSWLVQMSIASALSRITPTQRWPVVVQLATHVDLAGAPNLERMVWYAMEPAVAAIPSTALPLASQFSPKLRRWVARRITEGSESNLFAMFENLKGNSDRTDVTLDLLLGMNDGLSQIRTEQMPKLADQVINQL